MFQYALGRHLAEKNSTILKLDVSGFEAYKLRRYNLHCFNIWEHITTAEEIRVFKTNSTSWVSKNISRIGNKIGFPGFATSTYYRDCRIVQEKSRSYDPTVFEARGDIYLQGYWQSEKYFLDIRDILLREFTVKHEQDLQSQTISKQIHETESISLHVRRGDYMNNPMTKQVHGVCSLAYYQKAIKYIIQQIPDAHFYIFSDEPGWVKHNLKIDYPVTVVDHNDVTINYEDLRLMSQCKHHIIANSSFSWWGAWLCRYKDKIVVAPKRWFANGETDAASRFPSTWVLM